MALGQLTTWGVLALGHLLPWLAETGPLAWMAVPAVAFGVRAASQGIRAATQSAGARTLGRLAMAVLAWFVVVHLYLQPIHRLYQKELAQNLAFQDDFDKSCLTWPRTTYLNHGCAKTQLRILIGPAQAAFDQRHEEILEAVAFYWHFTWTLHAALAVCIVLAVGAMAARLFDHLHRRETARHLAEQQGMARALLGDTSAKQQSL